MLSESSYVALMLFVDAVEFSLSLFIGLTRDVEDSQTVFAQNDGFSVLLRAMQTGDEKLQTKAAFMMKAMCVSKPQFKGTFVVFTRN